MIRPFALALSAATGAAALVAAPHAVAEPATAVYYPPGAVSTRYAGAAFDACTAPPVAAINRWSASPYRTVGIYFGGVNRTCAQPHLSAGWVGAVSRMGWRLLPIYKGLQPPCGGRPTDRKIVPALAASQGTSAARDAVARARALGLLPGSGLYNDIEHYSTTDAVCRTAVLRYLSSWTRELHRLGFVSGVYANLNSGAQHLAQTYDSTAYARPDALWIARYDGNPSLTGWTGIPDSRWAVHQRAKQYLANRVETYGGVAINIDRNQLNAPVASVAYAYRVVGTNSLNARSGPSSSYSLVRRYGRGAILTVVCQTPGPRVGTSGVWDKLSDGSYVADHYVSTPSQTGYSAPLPRCFYPYQVILRGGVNTRSGPGTGYAVTGTLPGGGLAWIHCQTTGSRVGSTRVWDRLDTGRWVSDYYVATPSKITYSRPIPRC